ncbi:hypothetical protein JCM8097_000140 [Rhodosporidiobolus ruineniae]
MTSVDLGTLTLRRIDKEPEEPDSDDEGFVGEEEEAAERYFKEVRYEIVESSGRIVGTVNLWFVNLLEIEEDGEDFFLILDDHSRTDFAATLFDDEGQLKSRFGREGTGVWKKEEMEDVCSIVYLEDMRVEASLRGQGIGSWVLRRLFEEKNDDDLSLMSLLYTYPSSLHSEWPAWNHDQPDPHKAEKEAMTQRLLKFYRRAGFRRVGTTPYFCCARYSHPSQAIHPDFDAAEVRSPDEPVNPGDARLFEVAAAQLFGRGRQ